MTPDTTPEQSTGAVMDRRGMLKGVAAYGAAGALGAAGLLGAAGAPGAALAGEAPRRFVLFRGDEEVGYHTLAAQRAGDDLTVEINILIEVRRLGIRFYVYEHRNQETWRAGRLIRMEAETNDDGTKDFCKVAVKGDRLAIEGSSYSGAAPAQARPSSYWNRQNFEAKPWFSTQTGQIFELSFTKGREEALERWEVTGDFSTTLLYDAKREWRGCRFDAKGTPMLYRQTSPGPDFAALI